MSSFSYPIYLLRQYFFCPRIPYLIETCGIKPVEKDWMKRGNIHQDNLEKLYQRRTFERFDIDKIKIHKNLVLNSSSYGIHGKVDLLIEGVDEVIPVEIKLGNKVYFGYRAQLIAYGLLAEEVYSKDFQLGFLLMGIKGKALELNPTLEERDKVIKSIEHLYKVIESKSMPDTNASVHQCSQCEFLNFCNDRF